MSELPTSGTIERGVHRLTLRVYFEDTDVSGIVYHANYLRFMERARTEMLRCAGVEHSAIIAAGGGFYAVHSALIRFHAPAKLDDILVVESRVAVVRAATTIMNHRILRGQQRLSEADVTAAWLDAGGRPQRQPAEWRARFDALRAAHQE